jgi:acyl-CoA synthetase (AMP-forming)/AMP-acid ligase II
MISLLRDRVARQGDRRPGAYAIVAGEERVSYGELDARSYQLARLLRDAAGCGGRVALRCLADRGIAVSARTAESLRRSWVWQSPIAQIHCERHSR